MCATIEIDKVSAVLGLEFEDKSLLVRALTHTSYAAEHGQDRALSNERLEFLGDAILKAVMAEQLMTLMEDADEGRLSKVSAQAVSGQALARAAVDLGVSDFIMLGHGEESSGGRCRQRNLAGAMEAIIGAVYLDSGFDEARSFIIRALASEIHDAITGPENDHKTAFQEAVQARSLGQASYRTVKSEGPPHKPWFTVEALIADRVVGTGEGPSKRAAEQEAAKDGLRMLENGESAWVNCASDDE
ncbi:MAG: ribonuclease III [Bacillota bacterium]|nr:ribonuclease III [Bacillota bacterium]HOK70154.1 ribonuclease III [Bacillota bacterium]